MIPTAVASGTQRRDFLKLLASTGAALCLWPGKALSRSADEESGANVPPFDFQYRTISVDHLPEIKEWFEKLDRQGKLNKNETFRRYISQFVYHPPEEMPNARSILIVAYQLGISSVTAHLDGRRYVLLIPSGYADDGVPPAIINEKIAEVVLGDAKGKLVPARLPCKTLAVRSGLAEYGLNNITFVEKYGSFYQLVPFYVEPALEDHWGKLKKMRICKGCTICMKACPTTAISEKSFVIDISKCIPLYNELPDPLPDWLDPKVHHTLVGCLKCQYTCPANERLIGDVTNLCDLTEEESKLLADARRDPKLEESIIAKLAWFPAAKDIPYFSRNFRLALANAIPV